LSRKLPLLNPVLDLGFDCGEKGRERVAGNSASFMAAVRDVDGEVTVTRSFDATAEETVFFPRLVGG
jgi:hypothetical protein